MISLAIILQLSTKPTPALAVALSLLFVFIRCHPTLQTDGEKAAFKIKIENPATTMLSFAGPCFSRAHLDTPKHGQRWGSIDFPT